MRKSLLVLLLCSAAFCAGAVTPQAGAATDDLGALKQKMDPTKAGVDREKLPGAAIYHQRCQHCHEGQIAKAPSRTFIEMMTPEAIHRALSVGIMRTQTTGLSDADERHVAEYLSGLPFGAARPPSAPNCTGTAMRFDLQREPDVVGWGFGFENTHFVPKAAAGLAPADISRLKVKWAFSYPASVRARSQPTFAYGALYVGSQSGTVYALDAHSGCIRWTFETTTEVRTPIVVPANQGPTKRAYFGDLIGRVYALDAVTGRELWRQRVDDHPSATVTGSPAYYNGTLYVPVSSLEEATVDPTYPCCTFRGSVVAFDAATGRRLWQRYMIDEPPQQVGVTGAGTKVFAPSGAAIWNSPTVDVKRDLLYVGTGNNYTGPADSRSNAVVALDLKTGQIKWTWQVVAGDAWNVGCMVGLDSCPANSGPDADLGSGIILGTLPDRSERLFFGLKSGLVMALDAGQHDRALWSNRVGRGSIQGGVQFGMAYDGIHLYVPISDMANSMDASNKQRDASAGAPRPGLYALDPVSGKVLWQSRADDICKGRQFCDPGILSSIAAIPGAVFAGHMDGRLRAYDADSGRVLWQYDTTQNQTALGGAAVHGGTIGGGGPVIHDGMVYTNSGYGMYFHMPGNVLLAFSVDGK
ncbi:MAG: PQQ-binding-like beta-propeller repeat protein [Gammaproteobacteria bacterium]